MALRVALAVAAAAFLAKKAFIDRGSSPAKGTVSLERRLSELVPSSETCADPAEGVPAICQLASS